MTQSFDVIEASESAPEDDHPPGSPEAMAAYGATVTEALAAYAGTGRLTDSETACELLNVTPGTLHDLVLGGDLDAVVLGGRAYVNAGQLQVRARERFEMGAARTREARSLVRTALRMWLAETEVTGDWEIGRAQRRPLVCRRRGSVFLSYGIEMHSVVFSSRYLSMWVSRVGMAKAPELASMPVGSHLASLLDDLAGLQAIHSCTPLLGSGRAKTVKGWLRVDPRVFTLNVPAEVAALIAAPQDQP